MEIQHILFAIAGGVLPAVLWLWYWTREDKLHPEPRRLLLLTFIAGGITVALAIPMQKLARELLGTEMSAPLILAWAGIEESLKYVVALVVVLWRKAVDEPIDMLIYMLTIALGFSAIENSMFLISPIVNEGLPNAIVTGNLRFFGATLLHLLSSSTVGIMLALSFYKSHMMRVNYTIVGVILAIILHTTFNLFILNSTSGGIIKIFAFVWLGVVILLLFFEKIKKMQILSRQ
jgi:RsiW-degrading membrane proteinase PrsW (M82 family)